MSSGVDDASDLYEGFHRYEPIKIGEFASSFQIPSRVHKQGKAVDVLYRSTKVDPETLKKPRKPVDYIHDHDSRGVMTYLIDGDGELEETPEWIRNAQALTFLGQCLGFSFTDPAGKKVKAEGTAPLPELYAIQVGWLKLKAALLVVQSKQEIIAMVWGGRLRVEPRGIVG
jgi:hypothetical protein